MTDLPTKPSPLTETPQTRFSSPPVVKKDFSDKPVARPLPGKSVPGKSVQGEVFGSRQSLDSGPSSFSGKPPSFPSSKKDFPAKPRLVVEPEPFSAQPLAKKEKSPDLAFKQKTPPELEKPTAVSKPVSPLPLPGWPKDKFRPPAGEEKKQISSSFPSGRGFLKKEIEPPLPKMEARTSFPETTPQKVEKEPSLEETPAHVSPEFSSLPSSFEEPGGGGSDVPPPSSSSPLVSETTQTYHVERKSFLAPLKKILPLLAVGLVIFGGAFLAFRFFRNQKQPGFPPTLGPQEITLDYWGLWESEEIFNVVLAEWEKEHSNIKINYTQQSSQEYRERLQSALARDEGPDIFRFHNTWVPMFKNELEPIPPNIMAPAEFEQVYYPVVSSSLRLESGFVGFPLMIDTLALFYNQDIFSAAGVNPPTTWVDLRDLASFLTLKDENGKIQRAGVALGVTANVRHWPDILALMMLQNGTNLADPATCAQVGEKEQCYGPDALSYYTVFSTRDDVWDKDLPSSPIAFATEKAAMFFGFSWDVFEIKAINPRLNFKIVPVPQLAETNVTWASFWAEGVAKDSQNQEAAWEFLRFLSSPETLKKMYQAQSKVRAFGELYPRIDMADLLKADPLVAPFINQAESAKSWYLASRTFDNGLNDRMIKYFEDAVNAVNNGQDPKETLTTAGQGAAQLLSQYEIGAYLVR